MQRLQGSIRVDEEAEGVRGKRRLEPFLWFMPEGIGLSRQAGLGLASVGATLSVCSPGVHRVGLQCQCTRG